MKQLTHSVIGWSNTEVYQEMLYHIDHEEAYNIKSLVLAIPITPQYHLILQYLGIDINTWFNNSTVNIGFCNPDSFASVRGVEVAKARIGH